MHWDDDPWLRSSELAQSTVVVRLADERTRAEAVRHALNLGLECAQAQAPAEQVLVYRALQRAYLNRTGSYERTAEDLAVSRTPFDRLLRRGTRGLAHALQTL